MFWKVMKFIFQISLLGWTIQFQYLICIWMPACESISFMANQSSLEFPLFLNMKSHKTHLRLKSHCLWTTFKAVATSVPAAYPNQGTKGIEFWLYTVIFRQCLTSCSRKGFERESRESLESWESRTTNCTKAQKRFSTGQLKFLNDDSLMIYAFLTLWNAKHFFAVTVSWRPSWVFKLLLHMR